MFFQFILKRMSLQKQVAYVKRNAVYLGTRNTERRTPHLYMLGKLIAEVLFEEDDYTKKPERLVWRPGLQHLESHLEKEFKSSSF